MVCPPPPQIYPTENKGRIIFYPRRTFVHVRTDHDRGNIGTVYGMHAVALIPFVPRSYVLPLP